MSDMAQLLGIAKEKDAEIERLQKQFDNEVLLNMRIIERIGRYRKALEEIANGEWPAHYNNDGDEKSWCQVRAMDALEEATTND